MSGVGPPLAEAWVPGRVCLLGEHTDWAAVPTPRACLVAPLAVGVRVRVWRAPGVSVRSPFGDAALDLTQPPRPGDPLGLVHATLQRLGSRWPVRDLHLRVEAELLPGRGFSSSAAVAVALARAVAAACGESPTPDELARLALEAERDGLGVNCGLMDPLACAWATPLAVRWGPPLQVRALGAAVPPLLAAAWPHPTPAAPVLAALGAALERGDPWLRGALERWGALAEQGAEDLERGDRVALGARLDEAQAVMAATPLPELHAPQLARACAALRAGGALGVKFSGAGGDRSLVAVYADPAARAQGAALAQALGWVVV